MNKTNATAAAGAALVLALAFTSHDLIGGQQGSTRATSALASAGTGTISKGDFAFHYDEALQGMNKNGRFLILSWNEIR